MGTGIPTTAAYIVGVTIGAQALGNFGVEVLATHLFVFYYSVLAGISFVWSFKNRDIKPHAPNRTWFVALSTNPFNSNELYKFWTI